MSKLSEILQNSGNSGKRKKRERERERERESGSHGAQGVRVDASNGKKTNDVEW